MNEHVSRREPLFSVVIPTYNRTAMLVRAVASVRRQALEDFEVIVVDDGSREPQAGLTSLHDPRIRLLRTSANSGAAAARNVGIAAARGRYISFLDDDDEYLPSFLDATWRRWMGASPDVGMSWCGVKCIDHSADASGGANVRFREFPVGTLDPASLSVELVSIGTGFGVTVKREVLRRLGGFNVKLKTVEDTDFFFRLLIAGYVPAIVPGAHVVVHNHHGPRMTGGSLQGVRARECKWLMLQYAAFLDGHPMIRERLSSQLAHSARIAAGEGDPHTPEAGCWSRV